MAFKILADNKETVIHDVTTSDDQHVILRVSPHGHPGFQQEIWAINEAKKVRVPAPTILLVKYIQVEGQDRSMCLMEKLDGEPLERGGINFGKLDVDLQKDLIGQSGEILSRIHSIETQGVGWIVGDKGIGQYSSSDELIDHLLGKRGQFEAK